MSNLDEIRKGIKSGKIKPAPVRAGGVQARPTTAAAPAAPTGDITGGELDALYAEGSRAATIGANSHLHGLRAVYEAGQKGARKHA